MDLVDARIIGSGDFAIGVGDARVPVARAEVADAGEVHPQGPPAVRGEIVDGPGQDSLRPGFHVQDDGHEFPVLPVVPEHLPVRARPPLEMASLLPAPGPALAQRDPAVAVLEVDQADFDHVVGTGIPVLELDLHAQDVAPRRVELELVVIAEPVELRAAGDGADRGGRLRGEAARAPRHPDPDGRGGSRVQSHHPQPSFLPGP
jgi:hypothetical protein